MSESSVKKEIKNCVSHVLRSSLDAEGNHSVGPLIDPKLAETVDQTVFSFHKEFVRTPCRSLIRAMNRDSSFENFQLFRSTNAITNALSKGDSTQESKFPMGDRRQIGRIPMSNQTQKGLVPLLSTLASSKYLGRIEGQRSETDKNAEIEDIRGGEKNDRKHIGGVLNLIKKQSDREESLREAKQILSGTSAPNDTIHDIYRGVLAGNNFVLVTGVIVAVFTIDMMTRRLSGKSIMQHFSMTSGLLARGRFIL